MTSSDNYNTTHANAISSLITSTPPIPSPMDIYNKAANIPATPMTAPTATLAVAPAPAEVLVLEPELPLPLPPFAPWVLLGVGVLDTIEYAVPLTLTVTVWLPLMVTVLRPWGRPA